MRNSLTRDHIQASLSRMNTSRQTVVDLLRERTTIKELEACFPHVDVSKRNSRVRNSLRKLVDLRLAGRVGRGSYCLTQRGKEEME